jgi:hypothetical protein
MMISSQHYLNLNLSTAAHHIWLLSWIESQQLCGRVELETELEGPDSWKGRVPGPGQVAEEVPG